MYENMQEQMSPCQCSLQAVRAHRLWYERTQEDLEHTKHFPFKNVFAHYFMHIVSYIDEYWYNVAQKKFCAHTDVKH